MDFYCSGTRWDDGVTADVAPDPPPEPVPGESGLIEDEVTAALRKRGMPVTTLTYQGELERIARAAAQPPEPVTRLDLRREADKLWVHTRAMERLAKDGVCRPTYRQLADAHCAVAALLAEMRS